MDFSQITSAISSSAGQIETVGLAVLGVLVGLFVYKVVRRFF